MIKKAIIEDLNKNSKDEFLLPLLTYEEFCESNLYTEGSSDAGWDNYLRINNLTEFSEVKEIAQGLKDNYNLIEKYNILLKILIEE